MALVELLKGGAALLGVGAIVSFAIQTTARFNAEDETTQKIRLPRILDTVEPVKEALLTFSDCSRADLRQLERVGRRCASLVDAYIKVNAALSATVQPSIITLGSKYLDSIRAHLYEFYKLSDIALIVVNKQLLPVNIDLKHAHESLFIMLECIADSVSVTAREKLEQQVAEQI